jgi:hypothetical protein
VLSPVHGYSNLDRVFDASTAEHCGGVLSRFEIEAEGRTEHLYLVQETNKRGPLKIGIAGNPVERRRTIQVDNPRPVFLLAWVVAPYRLEKTIHSQLVHDCISGEWFRPTPYVWGVVAWYFAALGIAPCTACEHEMRCREAGLDLEISRFPHSCGRPRDKDGAAKHARLAANLHRHMSGALEISEFPTPSSREDER